MWLDGQWQQKKCGKRDVEDTDGHKDKDTILQIVWIIGFNNESERVRISLLILILMLSLVYIHVAIKK